MKKRPITLLAAACALAVTTLAQEPLTSEQAEDLVEISQGFAQQATVFEGLMQNKLIELSIELQREDRFESEAIAKKSAKRVNDMMRDLSALYGEFIKVRVEYVLKAKNVLTDEQKMMMLSRLKPSDSLPYEQLQFLQPEAFDMPLNLSMDQERKLIALEAELMIEEIKLERDVELVLLDLRQVFFSGQPDGDKSDQGMMRLAELAGRSVENRVNFFLAAKDVLTVDQKRLLIHMLGLD